MKNTLIMTTAVMMFLFLTNTNINAQSRHSKLPWVGVKAGLNLSNLHLNESADTKQIMGYNLGLYLKVPITEFLAIQPEFYYTTKGAEVSYNDMFVNGTARFTSNYLEVPLLVVANITENFNIHIGPYVSYLLSGSVTNESNVVIFDFEKNIDTDNFNRFETGLAVGAGLDLGIIGLGARYNYGLTKVGKEKTYNGTKYTFPDAENSVFNFYVSIALN